MNEDGIRHNNMHHVPAPIHFEGASELEIALVCRIATIVNLHVLRGGMLSATGHVVTVVNKMMLAKEMPLTCAETGYVLLHDAKSPKSKAYLVKRDNVERMLKGLCYGKPEGGEAHAPEDSHEWEQYDGPDYVGGGEVHFAES